MAIDWSNPKPSNRAYLQDILLGYLERIAAGGYYSISDPTQLSTFNGSKLAIPFTQVEWHVLAKTLLCDPASEEGSQAALIDAANILLKYLIAGTGLTGYYAIDPDSPPLANWQWNGSFWTDTYLPDPNSPIKNESAGYIAQKAQWVTDYVEKGISLDGDTAKAIWLSMHRALKVGASYLIPCGQEGYDPATYGNAYLGALCQISYLSIAADTLHAKPANWPYDVGVHSSDDYENFTSVADCWTYGKSYWDKGNDENQPDTYWSTAGYYSTGGVHAGFVQDVGLGGYTMQWVHGYKMRQSYRDENGNLVYDNTNFGAEGINHSITIKAYFPYTQNADALVNVPPPGKMVCVICPAIRAKANSNGTFFDQYGVNNKPTGDVEGWGVFAGKLSSDRYTLLEPLTGVAFNSASIIEDYGAAKNMDALGDAPVPDDPAENATSDKCKGWAAPNGYFLMLRLNFQYCN